MKVLYVGVYKDGTGWAHAAQNYILALDAAGVDVVPRAIKQSHIFAEVDPRILELEKKSSRGCDIIIQNTLPFFMEYSGHFKKNIGIYFTETDSFTGSCWPSRLNLMDSLWVCNDQMLFSARKSGVRTPIKTVPVPCDTERYERAESSDVNTIAELTNERFRFYFIGEVKRRKNLVALLKAFHIEFGINEPVDLVIKANIGEDSEDECKKHVEEIARTVKENLKLYGNTESYKKEILMTSYLSDRALLDLHKCCDCLVAPSFAEAWCIPAFDAMAMGNTPIVNNVGGMSMFVNSKNGWVIQNYKEPVFGMTDTFHDLYSGRENWWSIDVSLLRSAMREAYENKQLKSEKSSQGICDRYDYSLSAVGQRMKELLYA